MGEHRDPIDYINELRELLDALGFARTDHNPEPGLIWTEHRRGARWVKAYNGGITDLFDDDTGWSCLVRPERALVWSPLLICWLGGGGGPSKSPEPVEELLLAWLATLRHDCALLNSRMANLPQTPENVRQHVRLQTRRNVTLEFIGELEALLRT